MTNYYYQKLKARLRKEAYEKYQNLSGEKKDERPKKAQEVYRNLSEEKIEKHLQHHYECN